MASLLEEPAQTTLSPVQQLRSTMAAVRLIGSRKTLSPAQKAQAAESFGAEGDSSAEQLLLYSDLARQLVPVNRSAWSLR